MKFISQPVCSSLIAILSATAFVACAKKDQPAQPETPAVEASPVDQAAATTNNSNVHAFTIGEYPAFALRDGDLDMPNDNQVFGVGRTPEEVAAVLSAAGQPTDKLHLTIEPLVVKVPNKVLLFDTGAGSLFGPGSGKLLSSMGEAGVDPNSITDIFISHSHGDHVGGLVNAEGKLTFPNATIHIQKAEWEHMSSDERYKAWLPTLTTKVNAFAPGAELVPGIVKAVDIQGHTPGHSGYKITSGEASLLYVGDSMHHFVVSVQKPEWQIAFDGDHPVASASRAALIAESAANGQRVYAVHFPFPGIGKFEKQGDTHVWIAE